MFFHSSTRANGESSEAASRFKRGRRAGLCFYCRLRRRRGGGEAEERRLRNMPTTGPDKHPSVIICWRCPGRCVHIRLQHTLALVLVLAPKRGVNGEAPAH